MPDFAQFVVALGEEHVDVEFFEFGELPEEDHFQPFGHVGGVAVEIGRAHV